MKRILAACVLLMAGAWASGQVNGQGGVYINGVLQGGGGSSYSYLWSGGISMLAPTTDAAPDPLLLRAANAWPGAATNTAGANTVLAGGIGRRIFTVVAYDNGTVPLSTVTITVNGAATVLTEGTDWFDTTGNNEMATSLATAIDGIAGVSATASSAVVRIVPDVGTYSLTIAKTAADAGMTATSGTNGAVGSQDQLTILNAGGNIILDTNGATGFRIRNAANDGYASSVSMGTAYVWGGNNINLINDASVVALGGSLGVGITYSAPGVMAVCNGSSSNSLGSVIASTAITAVGTASANGYIRTGVYKRAWTNAEVVAFGAVLSGDLKVATLPAKTIVRNAYLVIDSQASGTTTLTASLGRTSTAYVDYIVASDAKVAANTVYGDVRSITDQFTYSFFDLNTDLPDTLDVPSIYVNRAGAKIITEIYCEADTANGAVINLTNAGDTVLSSNLTCTTAGAASASFISGKNVVALNAKVSHVTVSVVPGLRRLNVVAKYTNVSGEGGPNLNGYDLPSSTATTDVYLQFIATGANLDQVTGCTGTVYLLTETVP